MLARVPVRQWVLSLPYEIRYRLAWDGALVSAMLGVFQRVVHGWYRRQAKVRGFAGGRCGAVTFVQRFGSALNLNPHLHVLVLDGVYIAGADGSPRFLPAPRLTDADVRKIVETTARRVIRLLQRLCFSSRGFSLHAATRVGARDRGRLEQLCRYVMRPPLAAGRLAAVDAETLSFALKTPWSDGTTHLLLSPDELIEKLAALVPPPRLNLVRYHGVVAPHAADRSRIVPGPATTADEAEDGTGHVHAGAGPSVRHRLSWAKLLARVFRIDVSVCPDCGGPMRVIAALTEPASIRRCLQGMGLSGRAPPIAPARPAPQAVFDYVT